MVKVSEEIMRKKQDLPSRVRLMWFMATSQNPNLSHIHGADGWEVFRAMAGKETQEEIAHTFGISVYTVYRWIKEYKAAV